MAISMPIKLLVIIVISLLILILVINLLPSIEGATANWETMGYIRTCCAMRNICGKSDSSIDNSIFCTVSDKIDERGKIEITKLVEMVDYREDAIGVKDACECEGYAGQGGAGPSGGVCGDKICNLEECQTCSAPCVSDCGFDCDGNGVKESWSCDSGGECVSGTRKCENNILYNCDLYGDWNKLRDCTQGCKDNTQCVDSICYDSDGINFYVKGTTSWEEDGVPVIGHDFCFDEFQIGEYYCDGNTEKIKEYNCPKGCDIDNKVCRPIICGDDVCQSEEECEICSKSCMQDCGTDFDGDGIKEWSLDIMEKKWNFNDPASTIVKGWTESSYGCEPGTSSASIDGLGNLFVDKYYSGGANGVKLESSVSLLTDFSISTSFTLDSHTTDEMGQYTIYLVNSNGKRIAYMKWEDDWANSIDNTYIESGTFNSVGSSNAIYRSYNLGEQRTSTYNTGTHTMELKRIGNSGYEFYIDGQFKESDILSTWSLNEKVSKIEIIFLKSEGWTERDIRVDWIKYNYRGNYPICDEGLVTSICYCDGIIRNSGKCCNGAYQISPCPSEMPLMLYEIKYDGSQNLVTTTCNPSRGEWEIKFTQGISNDKWGYLYPSNDWSKWEYNTDQYSTNQFSTLSLDFQDDTVFPYIRKGDFISFKYRREEGVSSYQAKIYLPKITGNKRIYVADDGSTYWDQELSQLANSPSFTQPIINNPLFISKMDLVDGSVKSTTMQSCPGSDICLRIEFLSALDIDSAVIDLLGYVTSENFVWDPESEKWSSGKAEPLALHITTDYTHILIRDGDTLTLAYFDENNIEREITIYFPDLTNRKDAILYVAKDGSTYSCFEMDEGCLEKSAS